MIKRIFDIFVSLFVLIVFSPIYIIIGYKVYKNLGSPVLFKQIRPGLNGKPFNMFKFRTMKDAVDKKGNPLPDSERLTNFGKMLRSTSLDELPEFWNVLKGDMSIVGPRPHMIYHTQVYSDLIDKYMVRHFCKPGITGWAQVTGYRGETTELWQMEERVEHDIWYIEHWSFALDLRIILRTISSMFIPDKHAY